MANDTILVSSSEMETLASEFTTQANELRTQIANTEKAVAGLNAFWTGANYDTYKLHWDATVKSANLQMDTLEDTAQAIKKAAQDYEAADSEIAKNV